MQEGKVPADKFNNKEWIVVDGLNISQRQLWEREDLHRLPQVKTSEQLLSAADQVSNVVQNHQSHLLNRRWKFLPRKPNLHLCNKTNRAQQVDTYEKSISEMGLP